jgi:hypothetical protein
MNKALHKQTLKQDMIYLREYIEDLKKEHRGHQREAKKTITKIQRELKRLRMKQELYQSL